MASRKPIPTTNASWLELEPHLSKQLQQGCAELQLSLDAGQLERLLAYVALLSRWNQTYNLTAVREPEQMVTRHLLDSLVIAPFLPGQRYLDVGTGAGLPGVPLAVVFPDREFHLLDSNGKKMRFLFQVKTALCLDNMVVHHARVESFRSAEPFDAVLSRAFASLQDMLQGCRHLVARDGRIMAMKGAYPDQELEAVRQDCADLMVHPLDVPGLGKQRHLVEIALRQG